jgi:hypothetical protein
MLESALSHFLIYSSVDVHLGWLHNLAIVNSAAVTWVCRYLYCMVTHIASDICPQEVYQVVLFLVF